MSFQAILTLIGSSTIIGGIILFFVQRAVKKRDDENAARQAELTRRNDLMEEQNKAIMLGVQALLRDRLLQGYKHYEAQGWAEYDDKINMDNMYQQYHNLGENGVMTRRHEHFMALADHE